MIKVNSRIDFLNEIVKYLPENSTCIELGVFRGDFSIDILKIIKPKVLHLVDPWEIGNDKNGVGDYGYSETYDKHTAYASDEEYQGVVRSFTNEIASGQVIVRKSYSYDAVDSFPDKYFDLIYIDACHLYDAVKCDLRDYLPKLKETGLMCGHDYVNVNNFGVIQAVDEFIDENKFEFLVINEAQHDWCTKRK